MKFSIVIPAYNCELLIRESIESVIQQSYTDFELIIVDDGSTDNTFAICKSYEAIDSRIKVIRKQNGGPFSARVAAYPEVSGDYVLHVDADDRLRKDALETLWPIAGQGSYDIIFFEYSPSPDFSNMVKRFPFGSSRSFDNSEKSDYLNLALDTYCLHNMWSKAVKTQLILNTTYPPEALQLVTGEDHLQSLFLLDRVKRAYYLMDALYFYRDNIGSTTRSFRLSDYRDFMVKVRYFKQLLNKWKQLPKFELSDDAFDSYVLLSSYRYLESAVKYGGNDDYAQAASLVSSFGMFKKAINNPAATRKLRIDMQLSLGLLGKSLVTLSKVPIRFASLVAKIGDGKRGSPGMC